MMLPRTLSALLVTTALLIASGPLLAQPVSPDISVRQEAGQTLREYRVNGKLYAIRIDPDGGGSYFLVDRTGDGNFERSQSDSVDIPNWVK